MSYDKYERYGAYHWPPAYPGGRFWKFEPQAAANYVVAFEQLKRRLSVNGRRPRVLDIACGDGVMSYKMRRAGYSVVGLDFELLSLRLARQEMRKRGVANALLVGGSCMALPFADGTFDGAVAMELIEHLDPHLNATFMSEIRRVLRPGGVIVITTPHKQTPELRSEYHTQEFSGQALAELLGRTFGGVEVFCYYPDGLLRFYVASGKLLRQAWKVLWSLDAFNPFTRLTRQSTPEYEHVMAVGIAEPR